jgi:hypothetical protein
LVRERLQYIKKKKGKAENEAVALVEVSEDDEEEGTARDDFGMLDTKGILEEEETDEVYRDLEVVTEGKPIVPSVDPELIEVVAPFLLKKTMELVNKQQGRQERQENRHYFREIGALRKYFGAKLKDTKRRQSGRAVKYALAASIAIPGWVMALEFVLDQLLSSYLSTNVIFLLNYLTAGSLTAFFAYKLFSSLYNREDRTKLEKESIEEGSRAYERHQVNMGKLKVDRVTNTKALTEIAITGVLAEKGTSPFDDKLDDAKARVLAHKLDRMDGQQQSG